MNDVNANIIVDLDTSNALQSLKVLQTQISEFNRSIVQGNAQAAAAQKSMVSTLTAQISATKQFSTSMVNVESSVSRLGRSIDKNKLSLGEYFRYGVASSKTFGSVFKKEHNEILGLATERVKRLQTQYIALGEAQNGVTRAMAVRPMNLFNADTAIAIQRQQLFNKLLHDGSTSILNWGKNTQWAGRQLMVGFTVPLTIFGGVAGQIFMDLERQVVNFRRVYGDAMTPAGETDRMIAEVQNLAKEFTKYGIAVKDTVELAGQVAAAGAQGEELVAATAQSTRLATLGMIDMNQAMTATMALQTAFQLSNEELAQSVDFLNAVENQTVLSLDDVSQAIPLVAPVIKGLGGDVQDLAIFLTAMREGGVNASEGANALKSGLASLINPTKNAKEQLREVGININAILSQNKGDIRAIVTEFGAALSQLDKFERQQTLAKVFGKYQFARLGALFQNIARDGSQAQRVVDLTGQSFEELGALAEKELSAIEESVGMKFTGAVERLKLAIAPIGEVFLRIATPIIDVVTTILDKFNELSPGVKQFITVLVAGVGVVVPTVIMLIGLFGNFIGQAIKGFALFNNFFNRLRGGGSDLEYLANEELDAAAAAATLEGQTTSLTSALNTQRSAVIQLSRAYGRYADAANVTAVNLPQAVRTMPAKPMATGGFVAGSGNKDSEPALLMPGEFVVNKKAAEKYGPILSAMNEGTIKGYALGSESTARTHLTSRETVSASEALLIPNITDSIRRNLTIIQQVEEVLGRSISSIAKVSNLIVELPSRFNDAMRTGVSRADFTSEFSKAGIDKYRSTIAITGGNFAELAPHLQELDRAIVAASQEYDEISDANIGEITKKAFERLDPAVREALSEVEALSDEYHNLRVTVSSLTDLTEAERQRLADRGIQVSQNEDRAYITSGNQQASVRSRQETLSFGRTYRSSPLFYSASEITEEMVSAAVAAGRTAGQQGSEAFFNAFGTHLKGAGAKSRDILVAALEQGLDPNTAKKFLVASGFSDSTARERVKEMVAAAGDPVGDVINNPRNSPHPSVPPAGKQDGKSYAENFEAAAGNVRGETVSRGRRSASRPQAPAGMTQQEIAEMQRQERQGQRRRRGATRAGGMSPLALRAGEQSSRIANIGDAQTMAMQEEINRAHAQAIEENTRRMNQSSTEFSKQSSRLKSFGNSIVKGSAKMQGALFALDGLVFGLSFLDNGIGQFAQQIMPAVFGIQGLTMAIPVVTKLLPMLANPIGLAIAAIVALVGGVWLVKNQIDGVKERAQKFSDAMYGAEQNINDTAEFFSRKTFSQRAASLSAAAETGQEISSEKQTQAAEYIGSEAGKALVDNIRQVLDTSGADAASEAIRNNLTRMILSGAISKDMGGAIAQEIGAALENQEVGVNAHAQINEIIGPDGTRLDNISQRLQIVADVTGDATSLVDAFEAAGLIWDGSSWFSQISMSWTGQGTPEIFAETAVQNTINKLALYQNELDRLQTKFQSGSLNAKQYSERVAEIFDAQQIINWQSMVEEGQRYFGEEFLLGGDAYDEMAQNLIDVFDVNALGQLGKEKGEEFLNGFKVPLKTMATTGGFFGIGEQEYVQTIDIDLRNVDQVTQKISFLESQIADQVAAGNEERAAMLRAERDNLLRQHEALMEISLKVESGEIPMSVIQTMVDNNMDPVDIVARLSTQFEDPESQAIWNMALGALEPDGIMLQVITNYLEAGSIEDAKELTMLALEGKQLGMNVDYLFETYGTKGIKDALKDVKEFNKLKSPITKQMIAQYLQEGFELNDAQMRAFMALPDSQKKEFYSIYRTVITDPERMSAAGAAKLKGVPSHLYGSEDLVNVGADEIFDEQLGVGDKKKAKIPPLTPEEPSGGSGGDTETWLESLIKEVDSTLQILPKELRKLENRAGINIPAQFIDLIGFGKEGLDRIGQLLGMKGKDLRNLVNKWIKKTTSETNQDLQDEIAALQQEQAAVDILMSKGFSEEDAKKIASNSNYAFMLIQASAGKTKKKLDPLINSFRELLNLSDDTSEESALRKELDLMTIAFKRQTKEIDKKIDAEERNIEVINKEIDVLERQNSEDQYLIRNKERQIESYNREIEAKERLNEADEDRIEKLRREDEKSMRVADALSRELEIMSRKETEIKNAYDERIKALETIQSINEQISQQQRQQLGIADALSRGDVAAAAAAQLDMQQSSAQFAAQQARAGLQQGMENQIAGLTTSGGLTREQAEKQITSIKDQSYQTSLLIRDIEDDIYTRNLDIAGIKRKIRDVEDEVQVIEDRIYNRETMILDIQRQRLTPAEDQLQKLREEKNQLQKVFDANASIIEEKLESLKLSDAEKARVAAIADEWNRVEKAIANANETLKTGKTELGKMPERKPGQSYDDYQTLLNEWWTKRNQLQATFDSTVSGSFNAAAAGMKMNRGGVIPRYAVGGVAGNGSRDSVLSLLTPGEFVMRKAAVKKYGMSTFEKMNMGAFSMPTYSVGKSSTMTASGMGSVTIADAPVYNNSYSINVSVNQPNASADEIAYKVMNKIKSIDSANIRRVNGY